MSKRYALLVVVAVLAGMPVAAHAQYRLVGDLWLPTAPSTGLASPSGVGVPAIGLWPAGVMPIVFTPDVPVAQHTAFFAACALWSEVAAVACVPRTSEPLYLTVGTGLRCGSTVGMNADGGAISLHPDCWSQGTLVHELGHAFGLYHEHQRSDRDAYITVHPDHATDPGAFDATPAWFLDTFTPYDLLSVMHYGADAFATQPGLPTITLKPGWEIFGHVMGQGEFPSFGDGTALRAIYGGPPAAARPRLVNLAPLHANPVSLVWAADPIFADATYTLLAGSVCGAHTYVIPVATVTSLRAVAPTGVLCVQVRVTYRNGVTADSNGVYLYIP